MNDSEDSGKFTENEIKKKAFWSRKKVWTLSLIFYLIFLVYMFLIKKESEFIFLYNIPENIWFPIFNVLFIGFIYIYDQKYLNYKSGSFRKEKEGIIVFLIIFICLGIFFYNYVFHQSEYYKLKDNNLSSQMIAGIKYQYPSSGMNQITFYKKAGILTYRSTHSTYLYDVSSASENLKKFEYRIDNKTNKIIFESRQSYFID